MFIDLLNHPELNKYDLSALKKGEYDFGSVFSGSLATTDKICSNRS